MRGIFPNPAQSHLISEDLAAKLSSAARLRNLIVHRYWIIKDEIVYESVRGGLKDFEDFTLNIRRLLEKRFMIK